MTLIDEMGYDGKHSYEDTIEPVEEAYERYHRRIAILGGIDVNFVCRATPAGRARAQPGHAAARRRTRRLRPGHRQQRARLCAGRGILRHDLRGGDRYGYALILPWIA